MPKVSVIVPVYNTEKYLPECLNSLCNQTLDDIEVICVHDASPDKSLQIIKEFADKDSRIKIINVDYNCGVSNARNMGIEAATGEYIGFIDSDDWIDLDFYEKLYEIATISNVNCAKGNLKIYNNETKIISENDYNDINYFIKKHPAYFTHTFTTAIIRKELIDNNKILFPDICFFEDPYFIIKSMLYCDKVAISDTANYYYRKSHKINNEELNYKNMLCAKTCICFIMDLLNKCCSDKVHYSIVYSYLKRRALKWKSSFTNTKAETQVEDIISYLETNCKYTDEAKEADKLFEQELNRKKILYQLRNKKL